MIYYISLLNVFVASHLYNVVLIRITHSAVVFIIIVGHDGVASLVLILIVIIVLVSYFIVNSFLASEVLIFFSILDRYLLLYISGNKSENKEKKSDY